MKFADCQKIKYNYGSKLYSDEKIDEIIQLFYTLKDNRSSVIAEKVGLRPCQVLGILDRYDSNVIKYKRKNYE